MKHHQQRLRRLKELVVSLDHAIHDSHSTVEEYAKAVSREADALANEASVESKPKGKPRKL